MTREPHEEDQTASFVTYGSGVSRGIVQTSASFSIFIVLISFVGLYDGFTIREVIDEVGVFLLITTSVWVLSYQHKAIITRDSNAFTIRLWKQFTPLFVYSERELEIKELSLKQSRFRNSTDGGSNYYQYNTKLYHNGTEVFSCNESRYEFEEILPELFRDAH